MKITLDNGTELTIEEARELYNELKPMFEPVAPIIPYYPMPYYPWWQYPPEITCMSYGSNTAVPGTTFNDIILFGEMSNYEIVDIE